MNAETLQELLQKLNALLPSLKTFTVDENTTKLEERDHVRIIPAVAGG
jgi:molybdopterin converting factor small subunit